MKNIYLSRGDHRAISKILEEMDRHPDRKSEPISKLRGELNRAVLMEGSEIPPDVVKLGSLVRLRDLDTGEVDEWTLTLPDEADIDQCKLSVLAPIGSAIIGFAKGDQIEWETPGGNCRIRIESVGEAIVAPIPDVLR